MHTSVYSLCISLFNISIIYTIQLEIRATVLIFKYEYLFFWGTESFGPNALVTAPLEFN